MTDTTKRYRLKKDYVTPRFTYAKGADVSYLGGMYVIGIETFTEEALKTTPEWFEEVLPVSEPVKERIEISSFNTLSRFTPVGKVIQVLEVVTDKKITGDRFPAIKQAIESCLNEPLPQPPSALNDTVEDSKIKELESLLEYYQAEFNANQDKVYTQAEVDAIRADTWYAARKITDKVVGEIDFKDGDRCPFYEKYFNSINDYLSSLNLNSNDTGKELFTTLDGVKIFRGDTYFPVDDNFNILFTTNAQQEYKDAGWLRAFSTYDAAQYWVSENKPKPEQPTNDNAFVWDDEIRKEFELFVELKCGETNTPCPSLWLIERWKQDFKQSKQSAPEPSALPTKEWEIVSFAEHLDKTWEKSGYIYPVINGMVGVFSNAMSVSDWLKTQPKIYSIHSVRRLLPDMEVFSCKDNTNKGVIESFVIITEENRQTAVTAHLDKKENIGKVAVKVSGSLGAAHPNQLLEDLEKLPPTDHHTQPVVEDKPQSGLWVDINKGTIEEAKMLDKLWKQFKPIVLPLPKQKLNK